MWRRGYLQWHHPPTKFHENAPIYSKVISGGYAGTHTHTHDGDLISLLSFLESRLKTEYLVEEICKSLLNLNMEIQV
jgi:hypothetical protein